MLTKVESYLVIVKYILNGVLLITTLYYRKVSLSSFHIHILYTFYIQTTDSEQHDIG